MNETWGLLLPIWSVGPALWQQHHQELVKQNKKKTKKEVQGPRPALDQNPEPQALEMDGAQWLGL